MSSSSICWNFDPARALVPTEKVSTAQSGPKNLDHRSKAKLVDFLLQLPSSVALTKPVLSLNAKSSLVERGCRYNTIRRAETANPLRMVR